MAFVGHGCDQFQLEYEVWTDSAGRVHSSVLLLVNRRDESRCQRATVKTLPENRHSPACKAHPILVAGDERRGCGDGGWDRIKATAGNDARAMEAA